MAQEGTNHMSRTLARIISEARRSLTFAELVTKLARDIRIGAMNRNKQGVPAYDRSSWADGRRKMLHRCPAYSPAPRQVGF